MLPEVGQLVAEKYRIEGQLGKGGMAVVFAAHHLLLDRPVAMKILSPELQRTTQLVERFLTEARAAARVDSIYVARVMDVGTLDDGLPYIVMERLDGCDLEELLAADKQLPVGDAVDHVLQALQGLAHAHVLGVIHRDLKPANLFLARQSDGSTLIKILDFGIAKLVDEARLIARGQTVGSPTYMSPEQVRDAELVDPRTDIWSIGVVLYELLVGHTPFEADGIGETFAAVLAKTPAPIRTLRPDVPAALDAAVLRCLSQDPEQRFRDVAQFAAAIAQFGTGACTSLVEAIEQTLRQEQRRFAGSPFVVRHPSSPRALAPVRVAFGDEVDARLSFLYGDSTPSSLQTNFLAFLGDALDVCAQVLGFDDVVTRGREDVERLPREAAEEAARLDGLVAIAREALARAPVSGPASPTMRVAGATIEYLESTVAAEKASLWSALEQELAQIPTTEQAAREGCARAFEGLLLRHDLPGAEVSLDLRRGNAERYAARMASHTDYGLRWTLELEVPPNHVLSRVVRLDKLARIEVDAPELTGWLRKEIKLRPQRLDRHYIAELAIDATSMALKLCAEADGEGGGFDVSVDLLTARYQLARLGAPDAPYDLSDTDAAKLRDLHATLLSVAKELARSRRRLIEATLDGAPMWAQHDPREVVDRLVAILAPITWEIATHSLSATELLLKRLTADDRREEVFVSKAALVAKLEPVPERLRPVMAAMAHALEAVGIRESQPSYSGTT